MLAGSLAALAGFVDLGHFGSTAINGHVNDPPAAITAAVIGGTALVGG
jgi:ribose transport system permease protein